MFNRTQEEKTKTSMASLHQETVIAQGVKVEGDFVSQGNVIIDGEVTGSVKTNQSLHIGETAIIHANIEAENAVIAGEVKGNLRVGDTLELQSSSQVLGDIETQVLSISPGAKVNGHLSMGGKTTSISSQEEEIEE
ncbi:MAG: Polymer-forming cytoskeletal [Candidatus Uhrbacteria bacterium GW2011_GWE2_40_58]|nr:MAG: Polymer-forming cytoskeletal [Candidatus Uhrbacteria bacterium GW2011_GWF2_40_263]KKR67479.1 MAG: Polymer-forming cytoskeletal [Candidatus Uhrbacteria bacterium GW2011_GWE2_40_58]OGL94220.1 MAG: hypothetical protein A2239_03760 [Candidatus Uhrbacteria bacterium RIFOXYA2_FULL_40_9]OGL98069.1 MAG: hypothetical protein A2332_01665 [Candidatus Uhrbacteria bacterium RIFOXYB2_FULL_41_18]HBK35195.1 hypothetical protein [Candidatus Uhrbacteria bacterium]